MELTNEEIIKNKQKKNRKLIVFYKMISYDFLFYYTISYLFFSNVKDFTVSQIVFGEAFYPFFKILFQIPCTFIVDRLGKRKSLIIANSSLLIYMIINILLTKPLTLIFVNMFCAFGYVIKGITESTLIYDSIEESENKREIFSKYEGRGNASYFFLDAITALLSGYLFSINQYIPLLLSLLMIAISTFISFEFNDIKPIEKNNKIGLLKSFKTYIEDVKVSLKFIVRSNRLKALIIYDSMMIGLLTIIITLRTSLLNDLHVSSTNFGIIFAIMGLIACYSSSRALHMHRKHTNKTLSIIGLSYTISILVCSLVVLLHFPAFLMYYIILIMFAIQFFCKGTFQTLIKQYLNSFCDSNMRLKIYSTTALAESLIAILLSISCSYILKYLSPAKTILIIGIVFTILMSIVLKYMSSHVGLKPEEYPEKDIDYSDLL